MFHVKHSSRGFPGVSRETILAEWEILYYNSRHHDKGAIHLNRYEIQYNEKKVTLEEALDSLRDGDIIATSQCANEPTAFFDAMHTLRGKGKKYRVFAPMCFQPHEFMTNPIYQDTFDMDITFLMGATRKGREAGLFSFYPGDLHNGASRWLSVNGCNVFLAAATPMDKHGYLKVPLCLIHERTFMEAADRIILQVNPNLPEIYGDTEIHISQVDMVVEAATPLPLLPKSVPSEIETTIGAYVASLVEDGDCIQLGIGGIPDAAAMALMDKHNLGVHSEMITNSMLDLVEAGVINGRKKTLFPGKIIGTFAYGTQDLYDLLDSNPSVRMLRGETVNDPFVVSQNDNFVSINSCLSVDLTGQVCSESIGSRQYSGSGGQADMAVGAAHAKNGRNIIAVSATKRGGAISSINAQLEPGSIVTLSRNEIDYLVTEYGIAPLRGRSIRQRVENLISVAHPDFRPQLREDAQRLKLW